MGQESFRKPDNTLGQSPRGDRRRGKRSGSTNSANLRTSTVVPPMPAVGVVGAVRDQFDRRWYAIGSSDSVSFVSASELDSSPGRAYALLSGLGRPLLTTSSKTKFLSEVEKFSLTHVSRPALVAASPGWLDHRHFILGSGEIISSSDAEEEVIVAFEGEQKFVPVGTLKAWQTELGPLITGQPLLLFMLGMAFAGPLMRYAPPGYVNPVLELVGGRECGKSTLAAMVASVHAGNAESDVGGGEFWNLTLPSLDRQRQAHGDSLLVLDEGNLAASTERQRAEFFRKAAFTMAGSSTTRRYGDHGPTQHVQLAVISTTNTPMAAYAGSNHDVAGAVESRCITIHLSQKRPFGIFDTVPLGFATSREAAEFLRSAVDRNYGVAGRRFIGRLVKEVSRDPEAFKAEVARLIEEAMLDGKAGASSRVLKTFALITVALSLARRWKIVPRFWGSPRRASKAVHALMMSEAPQPTSQTPREALDRYIRHYSKSFIKVDDLAKPVSLEKFGRTAGFLSESDSERKLFIPAFWFKSAITDYRRVAQALRDAGIAQTEQGKQSKLTIKTPRRICRKGRVYCFRLDG